MSWVALFGHQLRSLLNRKRTLGLLALAAVPGLILAVVGLSGEATTAEVGIVAAAVGSTTFPIAALILAAATLRDERDGGTLPFIYLKPLRRSTMAASSIAAAVTATSAMAVGATLAMVVAAAVSGLSIGDAWATLPLFVGAAVGYSAAFVPLGYLIGRIILVGLAYVVVWEQIAARLITGVANTSIWRFALSIYADLSSFAADTFAEFLGPITPGTGGGALKLAAIVIAGGLVLTWVLRRRDAV